MEFFSLQIKQLLHSMVSHQSIDKETMAVLSPDNMLPKIHKPGNPGRPIVSAWSPLCRAPTEGISRFVAYDC